MELGLLSAANAAALVAAGLLSVLLFPLTAAALLKQAEPLRDKARTIVEEAT